MDQYQCLFLRDIYTDDQWLDFLPKGTSKASAIKHLKEYYHCDRVIAFGDGLNDLSMLEKAGIGIVMDNASEEVKKYADYITLSCDDDGVAYGIRKFCFK